MDGNRVRQPNRVKMVAEPDPSCIGEQMDGNRVRQPSRPVGCRTRVLTTKNLKKKKKVNEIDPIGKWPNIGFGNQCPLFISNQKFASPMINSSINGWKLGSATNTTHQLLNPVLLESEICKSMINPIDKWTEIGFGNQSNSMVAEIE